MRIVWKFPLIQNAEFQLLPGAQQKTCYSVWHVYISYAYLLGPKVDFKGPAEAGLREASYRVNNFLVAKVTATYSLEATKYDVVLR